MISQDFFPSLLIGHLVGDYILQNKWMALGKTHSTLKCVVHCAIYTLSVVALTWGMAPNWMAWTAVVFLSHYPIDRWGLTDKWLDLIEGRSLRDFIQYGKTCIPAQLDADNYHSLRGGFTAVVYTVVDNSFHLILMWYGAKTLWCFFD